MAENGWYAGEIARVRVCVDFPGAEDVWVSFVPVYDDGDSIQKALETACSWVIDSLARDAGRLLTEKRNA